MMSNSTIPIPQDAVHLHPAAAWLRIANKSRAAHQTSATLVASIFVSSATRLVAEFGNVLRWEAPGSSAVSDSQLSRAWWESRSAAVCIVHREGKAIAERRRRTLL